MVVNNKLLTALLLTVLLLPEESANAPEEKTERYIEITMLMDTSRISEEALARLITQASFHFVISCGEDEYELSLLSGERAIFPLEEGAQQVSLTETVDAGFIDNFGDPECSCVWKSDMSQQSAELSCEYTYQNKSGRTETVSGADNPSYRGEGLNTLQEKRVSVHLLTPESGSVSLLITNIAATAEYGALRIDQRADGESGSFDILVWLSANADSEALPVADGTPYYYRDAATEPWSTKKVECTGVVSLRHGASALFSPLPKGSSFCVRETKSSAKGYLVKYGCDMLSAVGDYSAQLENQRGVRSVKGSIRPSYEAWHGEKSDAAVIVTVENVRLD